MSGSGGNELEGFFEIDFFGIFWKRVVKDLLTVNMVCDRIVRRGFVSKR